MKLLKLVDRQLFRQAVLLSIGISVTSLVSLVYPVLYGKIIDGLTNGALATNALLWTGGLYLASLVTETCLTYLYLRVHTSIEANLKAKIFRTATSLSTNEIKRRGEGFFVELIDEAVYNIVTLLTPRVFRLVFVSLRTIAVVIILFLLDAAVGVAAVVVTILFSANFVINYKLFAPKLSEAFAHYRDLNALITNRLASVELMHTYPAYRANVTNEIVEKLKHVRESVVRVEWYGESLYRIVDRYLLPFFRVAVLAYAGIRLLNGHYELGVVVTIVTYVTGFENAFSGFSELSELFFRASVAIKSVDEFFSSVPDRLEYSTNAEPSFFFQANNLSKSYDAGRDVLHGIDLLLTLGHRYALLGRNGTGKSTLVRCLLGQEVPDCGSVTFLTPETDVSRYDLRPQIAVLSQDSPIVNSSFEHNVLMGQPDEKGDLDEIVSSLGLSHLNGKELGSDGYQVSGGERRKINLARFLYALIEKQYFVFDEAFVSLDNEFRKIALELIDKYTKGKTGVLVTHDSIVAKNLAESVVFLESEHRVLLGSFDDLLVSSESFRTIYGEKR